LDELDYCGSFVDFVDIAWLFAALYLLLRLVHQHRPAVLLLILFRRMLIRLKRIYNFWCSMLCFTPFAYCFVTLSGIFIHFLELTY
jgi:hypothetical protein